MAARCVNITELNYFNDCSGVGEAVEELGLQPLAPGMRRTVALLRVAEEDSTYSWTHKMTLCSRDVKILSCLFFFYRRI